MGNEENEAMQLARNLFRFLFFLGWIFLSQKLGTEGTSLNIFHKLRQKPKQHKIWNGYNCFKMKIKATQLLVKGTSCDLA